MARARPEVVSFFHAGTNTITHLVGDPASEAAAIIDPVLDFDPKSGRLSTEAADAVIAEVERRGLRVGWILETHIHADHLSAAQYLKRRLGARVAGGARIGEVQEGWAGVFNWAPLRPEQAFDVLLAEGDGVRVGTLDIAVMETPGHTPMDLTYVAGDAAFVGDTMFMPDFGVARTDFPGGSAEALHASIGRLLSLPDDTRLHLCHDYLPAQGRAEHAWVATVAEARRNIMWDGLDQAAFVERRRARDRTMAAPALLCPSLQVNIRGGRLPPAEDNGVAYVKTPLNGAALIFPEAEAARAALAPA
jgi:glyoxylase-like metal-dependent hydrolase (beta-lactamase superfamily II)